MLCVAQMFANREKRELRLIRLLSFCVMQMSASRRKRGLRQISSSGF